MRQNSQMQNELSRGTSVLPLVSVWMITYNHEQYIAQSIESILMQKTSFPFEIVIGEDGSTDNTKKIIGEYIKANPQRIKARFNSPNIGIIPNVIQTFEECNGKYIALCEGDDYWTDPEKLEKQVRFLEENLNYSMVITNRQKINKEGNITGTDHYAKEVYGTDDIINGFIPATQTILLRNYPNLVDFLKNFKSIYSGDRYIAYYCSLMGPIYRMQDITAIYRETGDGIWTGNSPIEKLKKYPILLENFHSSLGFPPINSITTRSGMNVFTNILTYCLKRPTLFFRDGNSRYLIKTWKKYKHNGKVKYFINALVNKFN